MRAGSGHDQTMSDTVVCLGCGGVVDEGAGLPEGAEACSCPPPSQATAVTCPSCGGSLRVGVRACPYCRSTLATSRCGHCLAWNLADAHHCQRCGRPIGAADPSASKRTELGCPRCGGTLHARSYSDLDVDECDGCGGLMVRPDTMDRIVASRDAPTNLRLALPARPYQREARVTYLTCPVCGKSMNRKAFGRISGVVVDVCRHDGVWFDAGELAEVLAFVERGGLERAREREAQELADARRRTIADQATGSAIAPIGTPSVFSSSGPRSLRLDLGRDLLAALASLWT